MPIVQIDCRHPGWLGELTGQLNTDHGEIDLVHYRAGSFDTICEQLGRKHMLNFAVNNEADAAYFRPWVHK